MKRETFDALSDREKWSIRKSLDVIWCCKFCNDIVDDGKTPERCCVGSLHCGNCDNELTRRTPGGQSDPFNFSFIS